MHPYHAQGVRCDVRYSPAVLLLSTTSISEPTTLLHLTLLAL